MSEQTILNQLPQQEIQIPRELQDLVTKAKMQITEMELQALIKKLRQQNK